MIKLHLARRLNHHMGGTHSPGFFRSFLLPFGTSPIARLGLVLLLGNLYFYLPFYALYLQSLGLDLVQISELSILLFFSTLLFEIPGEMLADHLSKKKSCGRLHPPTAWRSIVSSWHHVLPFCFGFAYRRDPLGSSLRMPGGLSL